MNRREMLATIGLAAAGAPLSAAPLAIVKDTKSGLQIFDVIE
jgi:hypothetical protein